MAGIIDGQELTAPESVQVDPIPNLNIPELHEDACVRPANGEPEYFFHCTPVSKRDQACDACGSLSYHADGYSKDRKVSDINMGDIRVMLQVAVPRYKCLDCGHKFSHRFECLMPGQQFTTRLYNELKKRVFLEPFSTLAKQYGTTIPTISKILTDQGAELDKNHPLVAPRVLGIDEKHVEHRMRAIYVDVENGVLLEMSENNRQPTIKEAIMSMKGWENIQVVTTDMAQGYKPLIEEILPHAKIVVDKFHVLQLLKNATQKTRTALTELSHSEVDKMPPGPEKDRLNTILRKAGKDSYLFKFGEEKVLNDQRRSELMAELCNAFPNFNTLRLLKDGFTSIYQATTRKDASGQLIKWRLLLKAADKDIFSEFVSFGRTVTRWEKEILRYFEPGCRFTNATAEGMNSLIQAINSQGRGYGFEALRLKAIYGKNARLKDKTFTKQNISFYGNSKTGFRMGDFSPGDLWGGKENKTRVEPANRGAYIQKWLEHIEEF